jgi:hypothetical protein
MQSGIDEAVNSARYANRRVLANTATQQLTGENLASRYVPSPVVPKSTEIRGTLVYPNHDNPLYSVENNRMMQGLNVYNALAERVDLEGREK